MTMRANFSMGMTRGRGRQNVLLPAGVMRAWQPSLVPGEEGTPRDSALYSILPSEWPEVRAALEARLTR